MKTLNLNYNKTINCETSNRNNGNPFEVVLKNVSESGKTAIVQTVSGHNVKFRTSTKNLFNL